MGERISQAEAARRLGVSPQAISKHVRSGLLPLISGKIDVDIAAMILSKHLDPGKSKVLKNAALGITAAPRHPPVGLEKNLARPDPLAGIAPTERLSYEQARTIEKRYQALAAKAAYEERMGELVPIREIEPAMISAMVSAREYLMSCGRKLAHDVHGLDPAAALAVIDAAHQEVLRRMSKWRGGSDEDVDAADVADEMDEAADDLA